MHELAAEFFNYRRCVAALIPVAWSYMDTASAEWRKYEDPRHRGTEVTKELARGFAWWLCVAPSILLMTFRLAYCFLAKRSSRCCDWAVNILILLCIVAFFVAAVQLEFACMIFHNDFVPEDSWWRGLHTAMLLFVALCLPMAILLFNCVGLQPPITTQKAAVSGNAEDAAITAVGSKAYMSPKPPNPQNNKPCTLNPRKALNPSLKPETLNFMSYIPKP